GDDVAVRRDWQTYVETPLRAEDHAAPKLVILPSPYRRLVRPLVDYVNGLKEQYAERTIAVVVSELVERRGDQYLLHNHRAEWLKADLLLEQDERVVIVSVPWYLR